MDTGQLVFAYSRLISGALAVFFAIMVRSKTRDAAWTLLVIGIAVAYIEVVHSVLEMSGIAAGNTLFIGSVSLVTILLPVLSTAFFIAAFLVMIVRQRRYR